MTRIIGLAAVISVVVAIVWLALLRTERQELNRALGMAAARGDIASARQALATGADPDYRDEKGRRPIDYAASGAHRDVVNLLAEKGSDVNARDGHFRYTPLMLAATNGHAGTVRLLVEKGARIDDQNESGETALMLAAEDNHAKVVQALLSLGADPRRRDGNGRSASAHAALNGHRALARRIEGSIR